MINWDTTVLAPLMAVFGESVTYRPLSGGSYAITGVFDDAYLKEILFEDATTGVTTVSAVLGVQLSQFQENPIQNDKLFIRGTNYIVREVRADSHGGAKLLLTRAAQS